MTAGIAPAGAGVPSSSAPQGSRLPVCSPAPRVAFRAVLFRDAHPARSSAELPKPVPQSPPGERQAPRAGYRPSLPGAGHEETAPLASPRHRRNFDEDDLLDPMRRHRATFGPPDSLSAPSSLAMAEPLGGATPAGSLASRVGAASSLEDLVPSLVRRIAWSGDRQRGTVRLELGAGELAGGTLLVQAEDGHVRVHLDVPPGVDAARWRQRISDRLASRGIPTDSVEVT